MKVILCVLATVNSNYIEGQGYETNPDGSLLFEDAWAEAGICNLPAYRNDMNEGEAERLKAKFCVWDVEHKIPRTNSDLCVVEHMSGYPSFQHSPGTC